MWAIAGITEGVKAVAGFLVQAGASFFTDWLEGRKEKRAVDKAINENKARLAADTESNNHAWEMAVLQGKDVLLQRVSFFLWSWPVFWAYFDPVGAQHFFNVTMAALPSWYQYGYLGMTGGIWGLASLKVAGVIK